MEAFKLTNIIRLPIILLIKIIIFSCISDENEKNKTLILNEQEKLKSYYENITELMCVGINSKEIKNNGIEMKLFDPFVKKGLSMILFYSGTCGPCKRFKPTFEMLSKEYINKKIIFGQMNLFYILNKSFFCKYTKERTVPSISFFYNGEQIKKIKSGEELGPIEKEPEKRTIENLRRIINKLLLEY